MNAKLVKVLTWLGLYKPVINPTLPTPLESLQAALKTTPESDEARVLSEAKNACNGRLKSLIIERDTRQTQFNQSPEESAKQLFSKIALEIECAAFVAKQTHDAVGYEQVLSDLVSSLRFLAAPSNQAVKRAEEYLEKFEESILLAESGGDYRFQISENDKWIHLPLLSTFAQLPGRKAQAEKELEKMFTNIPQLSLLEFATQIPMRRISFLEVGNLVKGKFLAPVYFDQTMYWYVFEK